MKQRFLFLALLIISCSAPKSEHPIALKARSSNETGITFSNTLTDTPELNILEYLYYYNGGGVAIGDINNDGLEDVFFTANQQPNQLYLNLGELQFKDISKEAGIAQTLAWSTGVSMEDIDNDGDLDIFVAQLGQNQGAKTHNLLYLNDGSGKFTESSASLGLDFAGYSTQGAFLDYDKDGDLDLYLLNHAVHTVRSYGTTKKRQDPAPLTGDRFYENRMNEEGRFVDVTETSGIYSSPLGYGLAVRITDINNDGWPDIYVGNDFHENDFIYINNQDNTFTESIADYMAHTSRFTMGVDVADLNNDGRLDLFSTDMMPYDPTILLKSGGEDSDKVDRIKKDFGFHPQLARNNFQLKKEDATYAEIALMTNTYASDWSWSVLLADFDNDWNNDIFVSNGIIKRPNDLDYIKYISNIKFADYEKSMQDKLRKEIIAEMPTLKLPNLLFQNKGNLNFSTVTEAELGAPTFSNGAAYADLDNDGDLDVITNNINQEATLYENTTNSGGLTLELISTGATTKGARVQVFSGAKKHLQELYSTKGFQSASSQRLHFGVPATTQVDSLVVFWPNGKQQTALLDSISGLQKITYAPNTTFKVDEQKSKKATLTTLPFRYEENKYFDDVREGLIPEKLSQEGPTLTLADFNNDGIEDFFIGGAKFQPANIWLGQKDGTFKVQPSPIFNTDRNYEDVASVALDIDNDGDQDLYVVSGGNDVEEGNRYLMDRLYINMGAAQFVNANITLPATNGAVVTAADYNQDGFIDLFIGSRSIPGAYGLSPESYILKNVGGKQLQPALIFPLGMVTDAQWVDFDQDELLDLVVVGDWMPITLIKNKGENNFENVTNAFQLQNTTGLWNSVAFHDFNGDGQLDILAANSGLNMKWKATPETPIRLYLNDFDANEQLDPIIFYTFGGEEIPFASKDKLAEQLPLIRKRFVKYKDFSKVRTIAALLGVKKDAVLDYKEIRELRSMLYIASEEGFKGYPLPDEAQQSTIEDFYIIPKTGDVYYVGNTTSNVVELGPQMANPGGILRVFDPQTNTHQKHEDLGLPHTTVAKQIFPTQNQQWLIATQNSSLLLLK